MISGGHIGKGNEMPGFHRVSRRRDRQAGLPYVLPSICHEAEVPVQKFQHVCAYCVKESDAYA